MAKSQFIFYIYAILSQLLSPLTQTVKRSANLSTPLVCTLPPPCGESGELHSLKQIFY